MRSSILVGVEPAGGDLAGDRAHGVGELGAAAVVDAHGQREHVVVPGQLLGDLELLDHRPPQPRRPARPAHLHAELVHLVAAAPDHVAVEAHEEPDLVRRAGPVLGRERVGRDRLHADLDGALDHVEERASRPASWPLVRGQPALLGPAAVAVHDDRDVPRHQVLRAASGGRAPDGCGSVRRTATRAPAARHDHALDVGQRAQPALEVPGEERRDQAAGLPAGGAGRRPRRPASRRPAARRAA